MNFIEHVLGISPDGGDGSLELLYLLALVAIVCIQAARPLYRRMRQGLATGNPNQ